MIIKEGMAWRERSERWKIGVAIGKLFAAKGEDGGKINNDSRVDDHCTLMSYSRSV